MKEKENNLNLEMNIIQKYRKTWPDQKISDSEPNLRRGLEKDGGHDQSHLF